MSRRLGQHFLIRDSILERLAEAACGRHTPQVIEIGPGKGALTRHLLPRTDALHAIELDGSLAAEMQSKFASESKLRIHHADVLETDLAQWGNAVITGNLPYYITSPILEKFLRLDHRFDRAVFLMQLEVAERLLASPGTRAYGFLSVATQLVCRVELVCHVPPAAFRPPPKVDSAGVLFERKRERIPGLAEILRFAGHCFAHKRKTLRNNLRPFYGELIDRLSEASLRAEQLPAERFVTMYSELEAAKESSNPFVH
ncbi:MAG: ribosomal RNA small subunit methyltransferase A [Acidobacteriaceae bacterium]|nr:ribosomal RNA small subunit methyltransferase A [Acidobacteriaceae bacterium]